MSFKFELRNHSETEIPSNEVILEASRNLVEDVLSEWPKYGVYNKYKVQTYKKYLDGVLWVARCSKHSDLSYEFFKKGLFDDHAECDLNYIPMLDSYKTLQEYNGWHKIITHYKFPTFFKNREFVVWVLTLQPDPEIEEFYVVSLPSTAPSDSGVVRGEYCSIERVKRENGITEWVAVLTSDAKGGIPLWIQHRGIIPSLVTDVANYIEYAKKQWPDI